ncbi:hypothetical protein [Deinococcus sp. QL22]|uniref:hypothetical protein n=1 Tax=Deinococcus sp. QL22 TaxID=2939437 RepID=UPI0020180151|nr:hypothetical protein [Deinococcus sp. QL22]UQN05432.1 hypothetical protein M1R55_11160 [Deinococcus sp. QL22]
MTRTTRLLPLVLLAVAALALGLAPLAAFSAPSPPPSCAVQASARPTRTPGIYTVTVAVTPECPPDGVANVRLESYLGGHFPRNSWFKVRPGLPLIRSGTPWYWRARVRSQSGAASYPLIIPGMTSPFSPARPPR